MAYIIGGRCDFSINGVSARTVGLVVDELRPPPMAKQRYSVWKVGTDTDLTAPDDEFDSPEYHIRARIIGKPTHDNTLIYAFLAAAKTLELSTQAGYYFKVQQVLGSSPTTALRGNEQTYDIGFVLAPFKYLLSNDEITVETDTVSNPGNRYSRPIWRLTGCNGDAALTVNGQTLQVKVYGTAYIDTERMIAYNGNNENIMPKTIGIFPFLQPGQNAVAFSGATGLSVKINGRCW